MDANTSNAQIYGYSVLIGIGAGMFIQTSFSVAQAKVPRRRASDAAAFIALAQNLGIVLALAISGSVFQNDAIDRISRILPGTPEDELRGFVTGSGSALFQQLPAGVQAQVLTAILKSMSLTYILVIVAGAMAVVGSLFLKVRHQFL